MTDENLQPEITEATIAWLHERVRDELSRRGFDTSLDMPEEHDQLLAPNSASDYQAKYTKQDIAVYLNCTLEQVDDLIAKAEFHMSRPIYDGKPPFDYDMRFDDDRCLRDMLLEEIYIATDVLQSAQIHSEQIAKVVDSLIGIVKVSKTGTDSSKDDAEISALQDELEEREQNLRAREDYVQRSEATLKCKYEDFNDEYQQTLQRDSVQSARAKSLCQREDSVYKKERRFGALDNFFNLGGKILVENKLGERPNWTRLRNFYRQMMDETTRDYANLDPTDFDAWDKDDAEARVAANDQAQGSPPRGEISHAMPVELIPEPQDEPSGPVPRLTYPIIPDSAAV